MVVRIQSLWFLLLAVGFLGLAPSSSAIITAPKSFAEVSPDGTKLLVMLVSSAKHDVAGPVTLPDGRVVDLRTQFKKSGIYDLRTFQLIAEIDWFVYLENMRWNDDFSSIVALNQYAAYDPTDWALAFVKDGIIFKSYSCDELLTAFKEKHWLPYRSWNWFYDWHDYLSFGKIGSRVKVATASRLLYSPRGDTEIGFQEFYEFDFETGEMLSQRIENTKFMTIVSPLEFS